MEEQTLDWHTWLEQQQQPGDVLPVQPERGDEDIAGYILARLSPFHGADAEVMALHVRPESRGQGYGAALLAAQSVGLFTLEGHTSRAWYKRLSGQQGETLTQTHGDQVVREVAFVWPVLRDLLTTLGSPPDQAHPRGLS